MVLPNRALEWMISLSNTGRQLAQLLSTSIGQFAPRRLLSMPTGQYVAWILANGSLHASPKSGTDPLIGVRVTV
jgi:hypothetical protein